MSAVNTGGPAFPTDPRFPLELYGMTLRDWFAGQVLAGFAANPNNKNWTPEEIAADAFAYADAMVDQKMADEMLTEREAE